MPTDILVEDIDLSLLKQQRDLDLLAAESFGIAALGDTLSNRILNQVLGAYYHRMRQIAEGRV